MSELVLSCPLCEADDLDEEEIPVFTGNDARNDLIDHLTDNSSDEESAHDILDLAEYIAGGKYII